MKETGISEDVRALGGIDLPTIQKHINLWFSLSLDLHGNEISTNAAAYFANGLKGRAEEGKWTEHRVVETTYDLETMVEGTLKRQDIPMRNAMNEVLRDWYVDDCQAGVNRWNKIMERYGLSDRLVLPNRKFNRGIGQFAGTHFDPTGRQISDEEWTRRKYEWLPHASDKQFLLSIMNASLFEAGRFANYIAPPARGIKGRPVNFEYVRTEM
jgi:benzoyl-CoA 2,3-dioxygenase component B